MIFIAGFPSYLHQSLREEQEIWLIFKRRKSLTSRLYSLLTSYQISIEISRKEKRMVDWFWWWENCSLTNGVDRWVFIEFSTKEKERFRCFQEKEINHLSKILIVNFPTKFLEINEGLAAIQWEENDLLVDDYNCWIFIAFLEQKRETLMNLVRRKSVICRQCSSMNFDRVPRKEKGNLNKINQSKITHVSTILIIGIPLNFLRKTSNFD